MTATGLTEDAFWSMTPRQTARAMKAAEERDAAQERSRRWHTWHAAALPGAKKFPSYKDFVSPVETSIQKPRRRQTVAEQIAIARAWSVATSGR